MRFHMAFIILWTTSIIAWAEDALPTAAELVVREIHYNGHLTEAEASFKVDLDLEMVGKGEAEALLFKGELAVLTPKLPDGLRLTRRGDQYRLLASQEGRHKIQFDLVAKVTRVEQWNQVKFKGPLAGIGSVNAQAGNAGSELEMLLGTVQTSERSGDVAQVNGFLGAWGTVSLRWQSKAAEAARQTVFLCKTSVETQVTPTVVKYSTQLRYEILQGSVSQLTLTLPASHALTSLKGEAVRDWSVKTENGQQTLTVDLMRPVEKTYALLLNSEQTMEKAASSVAIEPPKPLGIDRESGSISLSAEDVLMSAETTTGLRQVNAAAGAHAAYQFYGRPFTLGLRLQRIEPLVNIDDRVTAHLDETHLVLTHAFSLSVEKAGIYTLELSPQAGFVVTDLRGEDIQDWKITNRKIMVSFNKRVLGKRRLEILLEQSWKTLPDKLVLEPLAVKDAARYISNIGALAAGGLQLKTSTDELVGLREIPVTQLPGRSNEALAYRSEQADWKLVLAAERLAPRTTGDIFNLVTIGDGIVGGSATIRFAILNQGVQEFRIKLPAHWKNIDFTGPNIRRKEQQGDAWIISLQEKAWGGYTLVVTYDFQFDPQKALLPIGGIHVDGMEQETGFVAVTSAANLQIVETKSDKTSGALHRIDEAELTEANRALIARPVLLAYRYIGDAYDLTVEVTRYQELSTLEAVTDRAQFTTVLTNEGEILTQASFMVKNNDKQFQSFTLPIGAKFWSCHVRGEPVKVEKNGDRLMAPLPREANRDEAILVDLVYAQKINSLESTWPQKLKLAAPVTDVQTTYAEWELYVPTTHRLAAFDGNMIVARGTTYSLQDAWNEFLTCYRGLWSGFLQLGERWPLVSVGAVLLSLLVFMIMMARRGMGGILKVAAVLAICGFLAALLMPSFRGARGSSQASTILNEARQLDSAKGDFSKQTGGDAFWGAHDGVQPAKQPASMPVASPSVFGEPRPKEPGGKVDVGGWQTASRKPTAAPVVAGIRPIRIDIPKAGERYAFTKVLNARSEPLSVAALAIKNKIFSIVRSIIQVVVFLAGLFLLWRESRAYRSRKSFLTTLGIALLIVAIVDLLLSKRLLGDAMILAAPLGVLGMIVWMIRKKWKTKTEDEPPSGPDSNGTPGQEEPPFMGPPSGLGSSAPSPVVVMVMFAFMATATAFAKKPETAAGSATPPTTAIMTVETAPTKEMEEEIILIDTSSMITILSATYTGSVQKAAAGAVQTAQMEAVLEIETRGPDQTLPLFGQEVAIQEFSTSKKSGGWFSWFGKSGEARLISAKDKSGKTMSVSLPQKGSTTLNLKFLVKLEGDITKRKLRFAIPPALVTRLVLNLDEMEAAVEASTAVSYQMRKGPQNARVEAVFGAAEWIDLAWTPQKKKTDETSATIFSQNIAEVTLGSGVLNVHSVLNYTVTQGEMRQARVRLPDGQRLMRVEGEGIRTWHLETDGTAQVVAVELLKGVSSTYRLIVETEKPLEPGMASLKIQTPHALNVKRETGFVGLMTGDELNVVVESAEELQKVDADEFVKAGSSSGGISSAYRFLKPEYTLAVRVEMVKPLLEVVMRNHVRVGSEQLQLAADAAYTIKRTGVFALQLALPKGYRVEHVFRQDHHAMTNAVQWVEKPAAKTGEPRVLEVSLNQRTLGTCSLKIMLSQPLRELPSKVEVNGVHPMGVQKLSGFVSVVGEEGVQIKTEAFQGMTEAPAATVSGGERPIAGTLAFKLIPSDSPAADPNWKLSLNTEKLDSWVQAEVMSWVTVTETLVSGRAVVRYHVQNAPAREFQLKMPSGVKNIEITGPDIRRKDQTVDTWKIELQNKVRGTYTLTATWEMPWDGKAGILNLPGVQALGVERETGFVAASSHSPLKVAPKEASVELSKIDPRDLPDWGGRVGEMPALAWRYLRAGYQVKVAIQRYDEAEVLQVFVDNMQLSTVISEDGQMMTQMRLAIRNNARQYLEVTLPPGVTNVWSAFVASQAVRPSVKDGRLLLPLERSLAGDDTVSIELTYVGEAKFPRNRGGVELVSPALDAPLKNARWDLFLPPDYKYGKFEGSMKQQGTGMAVDSTTLPTSRMYSFGDYLSTESSNREIQKAEKTRSLNMARGQLAQLDIQSAAQYNFRSKRSGGKGGDASDEEAAENLEHDVRRAQGKKLLEAQQEFTVENNAQIIGQRNDSYIFSESQEMQRKAVTQQLASYTEEEAQKQVDKVQKMQDITGVRTVPLYVNLPQRGLHFAFSQTLQTEVRKPMTLEFHAAAAKGFGLLTAVALSIGAFLFLWWGVAKLQQRRRHTPD